MVKFLLKRITVSLMMCLPFILSACTTKVGPAEAYKGETPRQIFENGEADMQKGDFTEAIKRFEALGVQYPLNSETELAELQIIYAYYRKEEFATAASAAARFIREHPLNKHTDYALFMQGLSEFYQNQGGIDQLVGIDLAKRDLTMAKKAFSEFSTLVTRFPDSVYAPAAYQYMIHLRNMLARHQLQLAEFYYERKAYVAAINRANQVVRHYQGSPLVVDALKIMAKSYRALHLAEQEKEVVRLMEYNSRSS
jgi:outer membrane protein assembly factor BamD